MWHVFNEQGLPVDLHYLESRIKLLELEKLALRVTVQLLKEKVASVEALGYTWNKLHPGELGGGEWVK